MAYCISTLFIIFFSSEAIQYLPDLWTQGAITLACLLPAILILTQIYPSLSKGRVLPLEIKFIFILFVLGVLNVYFSEDQWVSLKGMSLFFMSGMMIFGVTFFLFNSTQAKTVFYYLISFCFLRLPFTDSLNSVNKSIIQTDIVILI